MSFMRQKACPRLHVLFFSVLEIKPESSNVLSANKNENGRLYALRTWKAKFGFGWCAWGPRVRKHAFPWGRYVVILLNFATSVFRSLQ